MPNADSSADDESAPRDVELTSEPGADSTSTVRPSASIKDGEWDKPRALPPLPPLPVPAPMLTAPPPSVAPPAPPAQTAGMPSVSSLSPRPVPSLDPRPLTAADLEDEVRHPWLASLAASRPTNAWLSLGMVLVGVAFVVGLLLGRTSNSARAAARVAAVTATPSAEPPAVPALVAPSAEAPASVASADTVSSAQAAPPSVPAPAESADAAKNGSPKAQLEPFNAKAAHINLGNAAARAMHCRDATAPAGTVATVVTFVPSGRVADVTVTTPVYAGTHTGKCIIAKLKGAQVPPYSGEPETLKKTIALK
ncbi:MAG TPA: hypothetical protein VMI54_28070 [Polyangiaceae bacterium]|nr:hypothetical protein [Polyangiaceae bacterium]